MRTKAQLKRFMGRMLQDWMAEHSVEEIEAAGYAVPNWRREMG